MASEIAQSSHGFHAPESSLAAGGDAGDEALKNEDGTIFLFPTDRRLLGLGLNECEAALAGCPSLVQHEGLYAKAHALGIFGKSVNGNGPFDAVTFEGVVFLPGGRFEFARDVRDASGHTLAIIIPAHGEYEDCSDLVALDLETGQFGTWRGTIAMLGQEQLTTPTLGEPITVHATVLEWLRAGRRGVVIIDAHRARSLLAGRRLAVANVECGLRLRETLLGPEPEIFVTEVAA